MNWTTAILDEKIKKGTLVGYKDSRKKQKLQEPNGKIVSKHFTQRSKEKEFIAWCLWLFTQERGILLYQEYKFHPDRKYRADWAILDDSRGLRLLVEYEGIFSEKSRHTSKKGFTNDSEKYNEAALLGFTVLRFTALNYKTLPQVLLKYPK